MLQKDVNWMYICTLYEVCFSSFYFHFLGNKTNAWWLLKRMNFEVALNVYIYIYKYFAINTLPKQGLLLPHLGVQWKHSQKLL